jgi:hypothetical protein
MTWDWYYLANQYRGIFYIAPENDYQHRANEAKLETMRAEQIAQVNQFFELNAKVHKELTNALLQKRIMHAEEILPLLARVQVPPQFPSPAELPYAWAADSPEQKSSPNNRSDGVLAR